MITDYCPKCEQETPHKIVDDEFFKKGLECQVCGIVWEMKTEQNEAKQNAIKKTDD